MSSKIYEENGYKHDVDVATLNIIFSVIWYVMSLCSIVTFSRDMKKRDIMREVAVGKVCSGTYMSNTNCQRTEK